MAGSLLALVKPARARDLGAKRELCGASAGRGAARCHCGDTPDHRNDEGKGVTRLSPKPASYRSNKRSHLPSEPQLRSALPH